MVQAMVCRYRCGIPRRDLPEVDEPWQTVWTWYRDVAEEGARDQVLIVPTPQRSPMAWRTGRSRRTPRSPRTSVRDAHQAPPRGLGCATRIS
ncbi:hypothetical protein JRF89_02055 [Micrococcus luteus]|nr:hypothetical protein [Micrococcus luteus]MBN6827348.1 hypothetical protein [Micrococcus luteus]MBN6845460.1 hypothetical protein [Micrococcus luteus]MBN6861601.1 hypothetical protein [Micrococcus luteus]MBN6863523.1 hypothetical protein [Micrococcus luteus]